MAEPRKILIVSFEHLPGESSASTRLTELIRALGPAFTVDVLTAKIEGAAHVERYHGARLLRVPMTGRDLPERVQTFERAVRRQVESDDYDLVHVTDPFGSYPVFQERARGGWRVVYDAHGLTNRRLAWTEPDAAAELRFATRLERIERHGLLAADLVLTATRTVAEEIRRLAVSPDRIRIAPGPVDQALFGEYRPTPGRGLRIAYVGRCTPGGGGDVLLCALRLLLDAGAEATLAIAGGASPAGRRALEQLTAGLGLSNAVEWVGPLPHERVPEFLGEAHVCVAPFAPPPDAGDMDFGSLKLAEYLASGRPAVAADTALHRELAGDAALFFRPGDPNDLAEKIVALGRDPALAEEIAQRGRARAVEQFDLELYRRAVLGAYRDLLDPSIVVAPDAGPASEAETPTGRASTTSPNAKVATSPSARAGARTPTSIAARAVEDGQGPTIAIPLPPEGTASPSTRARARTPTPTGARVAESTPSPTIAVRLPIDGAPTPPESMADDADWFGPYLG